MEWGSQILYRCITIISNETAIKKHVLHCWKVPRHCSPQFLCSSLSLRLINPEVRKERTKPIRVFLVALLIKQLLLWD